MSSLLTHASHPRCPLGTHRFISMIVSVLRWQYITGILITPGCVLHQSEPVEGVEGEGMRVGVGLQEPILCLCCPVTVYHGRPVTPIMSSARSRCKDTGSLIWDTGEEQTLCWFLRLPCNTSPQEDSLGGGWPGFFFLVDMTSVCPIENTHGIRYRARHMRPSMTGDLEACYKTHFRSFGFGL